MGACGPRMAGALKRERRDAKDNLSSAEGGLAG